MTHASSHHVFSPELITRVSALISPQEAAQITLLVDARAPGRTLTVASFLDAIFARASSDYLRGQTAERLAHILSGTLGAITTLPGEEERISVHLSSLHEDSFLFIALDDHPFIVSSLAEALSEADIKIDAFLHPIFHRDTDSIAVSFIDIGNYSIEGAPPLIPIVREVLSNLTKVGRDFAEMRELVSSTKQELAGGLIRSSSIDLPAKEVSAFLSWLHDGCFFFLGAAAGGIDGDFTSRVALGIWRSTSSYTTELAREVNEDINALHLSEAQLSIRRLRPTSRIHRHATLIHILLRPSIDRPNVVSLVGYLTSKAWAQEALDIPILRKKVEAMVAQEGTLPNSHDYKYIVEVIDNMPTDEALAARVSDLVSVSQLALGIFSQEETRSVTLVDDLKRRALSVVVLPPDRYSASVQADIQTLIESTFRATPHSSEVNIDSSKRRQFRMYISTPLPRDSHIEVPELLSTRIIETTLPWNDRLLTACAAIELPFTVDNIFPNDYKAATEIPEAIHDLKALATLSPINPVVISLFAPESSGPLGLISIFSLEKEVSISLATPVLENVGLEVLSAYSYECLGPVRSPHLLKLAIRPYDGEILNEAAFNSSVSPGLAKVIKAEAPNDTLNLLLRKVPINIAQISLLRGYCALLWQVHKISTKRTMWEALAGSPHVALQLCRIFDWKFNPAHDLSIDERARRASFEESVLLEALRKVKDITQDRVLRALLALIRSTVRTNYFTGSDTLALKLRSQEIEFMPHPRPLFEIFVFSSRIEGTHLRSARVARGGIRWSERLDDYRSEVLGLMKTQKVKNVIIVPSGAKGGFIVKNLPLQGDAVGAAVERGYREYISALLSLADTKNDSTVIHPKDIVIHDEPDPYFVVAADKGTATFSDIANSIAQNDFDFWLGDAFASGGSAGYDHKKYGITARGGWECVLRHFKDLGINHPAEPITVVGLGDMSGDVFGNAFLLSKTMALIAAFNHKHIFIDPKPDLAKSFDERVRLFNTPRSQWSDFNPAIISAGGGVFNRFDKEISLTSEIRAALGIGDDVPQQVDGERLIALILQAPVDLMWNGGIGTYVKARSESHADVNDGTNDGVRINADELRARVVGEGGNLGFTQKARVEFSLKGGRINTDAIDNSGGVDLSDHEVNLKLLFSPMLQSKRLTREKRNEILLDIAPDVVDSVLEHNREQALLLSISHLRSKSTMEEYRYLIRDMHRRGYLDRNRDSLPDESEIDERAISKTGLSRPELAICSAAIKMWVKEEIRASNLCRDKSLERFLLRYFPPRLRTEFREDLLTHPLRDDIIANEVVGSILPVVGISFIHNVASMNATPVPTAMKCILAADAILGGEALRSRLKTLDTPADCSRFTSLWLDMGAAIREAANWLLLTHGTTHALEEIVSLYANVFKTLSTHASLVFTGKELPRFERRVAEYSETGAPEDVAITFALFRRILTILEMLWSAREFSSDVKHVASTYSQVLEELRVNELFKFENLLEPSSKWEQELVTGSYQEIRRGVSLITGQIVRKSLKQPDEIRKSLVSATGYEAIRSTMADVEDLLRQKRPFQVAVLPVITRQLRLFTV